MRYNDISLFIDNLPNGCDTTCFSTLDASGSTSQAASAIEAIEAGCRALLIDEDTSATNFMVRDALMAAVVSPEHEPITPFVARVRDLWEKAGISSVIVAGSSGAFFEVADTVLQMERYEAHDITARACEVCRVRGAAPVACASGFALPAEDTRRVNLGLSTTRRTSAQDEGAEEEAIDTASGATGRSGRKGGGSGKERCLKVRASRDEVSVGDGGADLRLVEQIVDAEQAAALAQMAHVALSSGLLDGCRSMGEVVETMYEEWRRGGWEALDEHGTPACGLAMPRSQEMAAMLNRWRV